MHSIIRGVRRPGKQPWRNHLRVVQSAAHIAATDEAAIAANMAMGTGMSPQNYARHLRVIGQDLENIQLDNFNLECAGDSYLVWVKSDESHDTGLPLLRVGKSRLQKLWRIKLLSRTMAREESYADAHARSAKRLRYSAEELERMEREQCARRRRQSGAADGHTLSQLLRTVGDLVSRRSERLLGISWQPLSISIVVETPQGRKEIDVFRPDNLYDLWVRMYLRRDQRASLDSPR
ncbi:MAG TPA: hypothetical protein VLA17_17350 [Candidatus Limnocylindria bacterium]|nr:hypothetical protein [Candidatus Limnocylindria bacterium]